uniref:Uncharacterized protein n=1 Tax=Arundo donax TaxID=35708 RepID=A0A0A8YLC6_ARUDO
MAFRGARRHPHATVTPCLITNTGQDQRQPHDSL